MKIKTDFVTNSSSSSFVLSSDNKITREESKDILGAAIENFRCFKSKKRLIAFTQGDGLCDWIRLARGPSEFYYMSKSQYNDSLKIIDSDKYAIFLRLDRSNLMRERLATFIGKYNIKLIGEVEE